MLVEQLITRSKSNIIKTESGLAIQPSALLTTVPTKERRHAEFFEVIASSLKINTPAEFCTWAQSDLQLIFPHGMLAGGIGVVENETPQIHKMITSNYPHLYLQTLQEIGGFNASPVLVQWARTRRPVLFEMAVHNCKSPWLNNVETHGLQNMAAHGLSDLNSRTTTYFSFSRIPGMLTQRHSLLLDMLVPHLHVALIRAFKGEKVQAPKLATTHTGLTGREQEILQWLSSGKTNWEIAQQLNISENTVKNHVQRILAKLNVKSRTQAVGKVLGSANLTSIK